jgi:hypothetical protein
MALSTDNNDHFCQVSGRANSDTHLPFWNVDLQSNRKMAGFVVLCRPRHLPSLRLPGIFLSLFTAAIVIALMTFLAGFIFVSRAKGYGIYADDGTICASRIFANRKLSTLVRVKGEFNVPHLLPRSRDYFHAAQR